MQKSKFVWLLVILLLIVGITILVFIPEKQKLTPTVSTTKQDSVNVEVVDQKTVQYELKNIQELTSQTNFANPVWSPDGKKLAITDVNFKGIFIKTGDSAPIQITDENGSGFRFSWSPDSKAIVYLSRKVQESDPANSIKLVDAETGAIVDLTPGKTGLSLPAFSDQYGVVYSRNTSLIARRPNTSGTGYTSEEVLVENVPANIVVPTNTHWIVEDNDGIKLMDISGGNRKTIVKNSGITFACNVKVSPDGRKVMFFNNVGNKQHLFVYDMGAETTVDLGEGYFGQWLSNHQIVYCITTDDGQELTASELYTVYSDGSDKRQLTNTPDQIELEPAVSPDGKRVVYRDLKSGKIYQAELISK